MNIYRIRILYLFFYYFYCSRFITFVFYVISLVSYFFFFFVKIFAVYVLDTTEYMNRQQQPDKIAWILDAQADLGLRCPHMQKNHFLKTWF